MLKKPTYDELEQKVRELERTVQELKQEKQFAPSNKALVGSASRFENLVANIPGVVYQVKATRDHVYSAEFFNNKITEIFGLEQGPNPPFTEFYKRLPDDEKERFLHSVQEAVDRVEPWNYEGRFIKPDGETIWFSGTSVSRVEDESVIFFGILMDITHRKQIESSLRLTQFCFDSAAVGIYHLQSDGRILNVNAHAASMLGYTVKELSGSFLWDIDPNARPDTFDDGWNKLVSAGVALFEVTHVRKDGSHVPVEVTTKILKYDGQQFLICFVQDISNRKKVEEAVKRNERLLNNIVESMSEGLFVLGSDFTYTIYNSSLSTITNTLEADVIGKTPWEVFPFLKNTPVVENLKKTLHGEPVNNQEIEIPLPNERTKWVRDSFSPLKDNDGNVVGMVGIISDITRQKQEEADREKLLKELQIALENVKTLSGLLPICSSCKKIRNDEGYWQKIEAYLYEHTDARLSHGFCPDCAKKLYPDFFES